MNKYVKLGEMTNYHFLEDAKDIADASYRDYLEYVDAYLLSNYSNVIVDLEKYSILLKFFIPSHDKEFAKIATAINSEYNPINNYDMAEEENITHTYSNVSETKTNSGEKDTTRTITGNTTTVTTSKEAVINSQTLKTANEQTSTTTPNDYSETTTENFNNMNETTSTTYDNPESTKRTLSRSGNIGVTTSQQMITSTFELEKRNKIIYYIANVFIEEMTTGGYCYD